MAWDCFIHISQFLCSLYIPVCATDQYCFYPNVGYGMVSERSVGQGSSVVGLITA